MIRLIFYSLLLLPIAPSLQAQQILIAYHSESGNTERMAQAVAKGAGSVDGVEVRLVSVDQVTDGDLIHADAIIVGSPVYNANVSPEISAFIASWPFEGQPLMNKIGAAFVTAGGISAGEEIVQMNILQSMLVFGMIVAGGPEWTQPFGASAVTGEYPFIVSESGEIAEQFLNKGYSLGRRIAKLTLKMSD
jgi:NAD(P)H dehydrogenase (quinone)